MKRFLLVIAVLGGCGLNLNNDDAGSTDPGTTGTGGGAGGGGGSSGGIAAAQAQADCSAFFSESYCPTIVSCSAPGTTDQATCLAQVSSQLDCSRVGGETSGLGACKSDLGRTTCDALLQSLPASCAGVFLPGG